MKKIYIALACSFIIGFTSFSYADSMMTKDKMMSKGEAVVKDAEMTKDKMMSKDEAVVKDGEMTKDKMMSKGEAVAEDSKKMMKNVKENSCCKLEIK